MGIKVVKFGGSSVADAIQLKKVKRIIEADPDRKYVVVSAPGKRFDDDSKITDLLYLCKTHIDNNLTPTHVFQVICDRYRMMELNLGLDAETHLDAELEKIRANLKPGVTADYIASRGEYLCGILTAAVLGYDFVDPAGLICFDERGRYLPEQTDSRSGMRSSSSIPRTLSSNLTRRSTGFATASTRTVCTAERPLPDRRAAE